jgi:hypothetical protein
MRTESWQRAVALLVIASFLTTSCASFQDVQIPKADQSAAPAVQVGQTVEATTRDGAKKQFKVTAVEADALVGEDVRVAYQDMTSLRVKQEASADSKKTTWLVVGLIAAVGVIAAASGGGGGGSSY